MSFTRTETDTEDYEDPILALARDPDLNREKAKTEKLVLLIQGFPVVERKVSRLCNLSLSILQTLEKIELNLKNWAFMSLDINSANHFDKGSSEEIKTFNNNVSNRVIVSCQELTQKLNKITADLDFITAALRSLSPIEFISDSGTLLTSLTLRNIKLKDSLRDKVTVAYLKAKLITIGTDLEQMLLDGDPEQIATVQSYKHFVVSLLNQLNQAVEDEDTEERNECLAVISDMEQMFEVYKLERAQQPAESASEYPALYSDEYESSDDMSMSQLTTLYMQPMVHSITKHGKADSSMESTRRESISSYSSSMLQKSTLTEELPYLMSAFNLAKTLEEDVLHFHEETREPEKTEKAEKTEKVEKLQQEEHTHFAHVRSRLPDSTLYSDSQILPKPAKSPGAYIYANNSLLSRFGIKPQVITADLPRAFGRNLQPAPTGESPYDKKTDKNNVPLTRKNLETHTLTLLVPDRIADYVE